MLDVGELLGQAVVGEGSADPSGEVASGQVVVEDVQVAAQDVAAELLQSRGGFGGPRAVEVEPATSRQRRVCVLVPMPDVRTHAMADVERLCHVGRDESAAQLRSVGSLTQRAGADG